MAEKDPAFLFYPLNWLQGTAGLMPDEKGVYMDLLCHQHQLGSLPNDEKRLARMVGLSVGAFSAIWITLRLKFVERPGNQLVNLKLEQVMTERSTKRSTTDHTKSILSRFAVLARGIKKTSPEILEQIKKEFNVIDYEPFTIEEATERLTRWFTDQLTVRLTVRSPTRVENENKDVGRGEDDVGGVEGEEDVGEGWNTMPGPQECRLVLPEIKAGSAQQLMTLTGSRVSIQQVFELWEIFKIQNFTGAKFYSSPSETYRHFINWSKSQKINGTSKEHPGGQPKLGTSEARTEALRSW